MWAVSAGSVIRVITVRALAQPARVDRSRANTRFNRASVLVGVVGSLGGSSLVGFDAALGRGTMC